MNLIFKKITTFTLLIFILSNISSAHDYWQQRVEYKMSVDFDVKKHQYTGTQTLKYYNNSPDTLYRVYYHLYLNAFQPNSMMDVRSRTIMDPDRRVGSRISELTQDEIGYLKVNTLEQSGSPLTYELSETVLEVTLAQPIPPKSTEIFTMSFEAQVPIQIRRNGRDSYEGIDYSMAQWFPKMAEYDEFGWHTSPYVAREFYAPWGDYEVDITIDKDYVLAGTGVLQNPNEIGYGYEDKGVKVKHKGSKLTWKFKAENVHDFMWAADRDYTQTTAQVQNGPLLRFFYVPGEDTETWKKLPDYAVKAFSYFNEHFGKYGWSQYSIIQGGDGGMEYPMATLIANTRKNGTRTLESLVSVVVHESLHSWYQGMLATNESYYAWMDEGFTSFAESYAENYIFDRGAKYPATKNYNTYFRLVNSGREEPLSTHSDHFTTNFAYSIASYVKGSMSLEQLGYIIGADTRDKGLLAYFDKWSFKHPDMYDFIRVMEKQSGLELSWYYEYWVNSTKTIDYGIDSISMNEDKTYVTLHRIEDMPMPVDLVITKTNGEQVMYYIPLTIMRGEKANETDLKRIVSKDWPWTHPTYELAVDIPVDEIVKIEIDPTQRMADVDRSNNVYQKEIDNQGEIDSSSQK